MNKAQRTQDLHRWCKKPGTVRPGQRTRYRKATAEEVQERVEYCAKLLVPGMLTKTQIHKKMKRRYGLKYLVVDLLYIKRAERWLAERAALTAFQAKRLGVNTLFDVLKTGNNRERLAAESRLAEIFG